MLIGGAPTCVVVLAAASADRAQDCLSRNSWLSRGSSWAGGDKMGVVVAVLKVGDSGEKLKVTLEEELSSSSD